MSDLQKIKVMIVDQRGYSRLLLREIFSFLGVRDITLATNCSVALSHLRVHYRNVLFCDETAGDIAGFMKALRRDTKTKNIALPVFLVSAGVQEEQVAIARDAGMNGVVVKPLSVATVEKKLRLTLEEPKAWIATPNFIGPDRRIHREAGCAARWRFFDRRVRSDELVRVFPVPPVLPK